MNLFEELHLKLEVNKPSGQLASSLINVSGTPAEQKALQEAKKILHAQELKDAKVWGAIIYAYPPMTPIFD